MYLYWPPIHHKHIKGIAISCGENMCFTNVKSNIRQQSWQLKENNIRYKQSCYPSIMWSNLTNYNLTFDYINKVKLHLHLIQGKAQISTLKLLWVKSTPVFLFTLWSTFLSNVYVLFKNTWIYNNTNHCQYESTTHQNYTLKHLYPAFHISIHISYGFIFCMLEMTS